MIAPLLGLYVLQTSALQTPAAPLNARGMPAYEVEGVLLVTGDPAESKRAKRASFETDAEVARLFPASRYETVRWNDRYRIAIDRKSGPLGAIADRNLLTKALGALAGSSRIVDLARLDPETRRALKAWIIEWPGTGHPSVPQIPAALGIQVDHYVELRAGGVSRQVAFRANDPGRESMFAALRQRALDAPPDRADPLAPSKTAPTPPQDEYDFVFLGIAGRDRTPGIRVAADAVGKIETRLRQESDAAAQNLLAGLGYRLAPDIQGASSASRMPAEMRYQVTDQLRNSWSHLGFANASEAMAFLDRASSFEVHTTFMLYQVLTPGDPARMDPSTGMGWQIHDLTGAYLP